MKYVKTYESWFGNLFKKKEPVTEDDMKYIFLKMQDYIHDNNLELDFDDIKPKISGNEILANDIDCSDVSSLSRGFNIIVNALDDYELEIAYLHDFEIVDKKFKKIEDCIDYAVKYGIHNTEPITLTRHILTNESIETASNSDIAKDVQHIFYDVIDDINVSDYTIEFLIDGIIHIVSDDYTPEGNIEKVYINFLVGNEQEAFKELVPIIAKKVKIMNRFGFKYLEMKSNKDIIYHHKDGKTFGNTILVAFKKV